MLCSQLIVSDYPTLQMSDSVDKAIEIMEDAEVFSLPVLAEDRYLGMITKKQLHELAGDATIVSVAHFLNTVYVLPTDHFLSALKASAISLLDLLPVVNKEHVLDGVIDRAGLLKATAKLLGLNDYTGGILVLEMDVRSYSLSELSRIIEMNEALVMEMNTYTEAETGLLIVTIRVNQVDISDILAALQRHEYVIRYHFGEESYENELQQNYDALMHYLDI